MPNWYISFDDSLEVEASGETLEDAIEDAKQQMIAIIRSEVASGFSVDSTDDEDDEESE